MNQKLRDFIAWERRRKDLGVVVIFLVSVVLLVFTAVWAYNQFIVSPPYVDPERYPVRGIDVSHHNGLMNLEEAAADGIEFVFIKASEGESYRDPNFRINYDKARHAGLKIGAYHFFRFDVDGTAQAINLHEVIKHRKLDLGVVIDVERHGNASNVSDKVIKERLAATIDYLQMRGHRIMLYSNADGYHDLLDEEFDGMPLWVCSFKRTPIDREWDFWQYYHHGHVPGVSGEVDLNVFSGSREEWTRYLIDNKPIYGDTISTSY